MRYTVRTSIQKERNQISCTKPASEDLEAPGELGTSGFGDLAILGAPVRVPEGRPRRSETVLGDTCTLETICEVYALVYFPSLFLFLAARRFDKTRATMYDFSRIVETIEISTRLSL